MKEERKCSFCGSTDYAAKGLCRKCYARLRRNGTLEYKRRKGAERPEMWSEKTRKILELYKDGMRKPDIAREVGLTRQAVHTVIKAHAKPTNADKIRSMRTAELANWLTNVAMQCAAVSGHYGYLTSETWWQDWLLEEVSE